MWLLVLIEYLTDKLSDKPFNLQWMYGVLCQAEGIVCLGCIKIKILSLFFMSLPPFSVSIF